jgi:hypothetical protein
VNTDERLEVSIAGMVEAVILRRLADVQERAAADIGPTLAPGASSAPSVSSSPPG